MNTATDPDAKRPRASVRAVTKSALIRWLRGSDKVADLNPDDLAQYLVEELRAAGLAIHNTQHCVRVPPEARGLGRPMTYDEALRAGIRLASEGPPSVAAMKREE